MIPQRITGLVLLVIGVILLIFGLNASQGLTDSVKAGITGTFTDKTMWFILGGSALALAGAGLTFFGRGRVRNS